jgi:hypothetical protein
MCVSTHVHKLKNKIILRRKLKTPQDEVQGVTQTNDVQGNAASLADPHRILWPDPDLRDRWVFFLTDHYYGLLKVPK